jgi:hypothetical protein
VSKPKKTGRGRKPIIPAARLALYPAARMDDARRKENAPRGAGRPQNEQRAWRRPIAVSDLELDAEPD